MLLSTFSLITRLTLSVAKHDPMPGQARSLLTGLFSQKQAKPHATRQIAQRQAYGYTWSDEYRQGLSRRERVLAGYCTVLDTVCLRSWMETSDEALLQHLDVEQRYAEEHLKSLQPSAAMLRREIQCRVQAEEVFTGALHYARQELPAFEVSGNRATKLMWLRQDAHDSTVQLCRQSLQRTGAPSATMQSTTIHQLYPRTSGQTLWATGKWSWIPRTCRQTATSSA